MGRTRLENICTLFSDMKHYVYKITITNNCKCLLITSNLLLFVPKRIIYVMTLELSSTGKYPNLWLT